MSPKRRRVLRALGLGALGVAGAGFTLAGSRGLRSGGPLEALSTRTAWINTNVQGLPSAAGKVALINFWTFSCINSLRPLPYVRAWAEKYEDLGLAVIGVHTPEFQFEHDHDRVRRALLRERISYPVAIDNDYGIWNAFRNDAWPAFYFADAQGHIRHRATGEGGYDQSERLIQGLLTEARGHRVDDAIAMPIGQGAQAGADWNDLASSETYLGYSKASNFAGRPNLAPDRSAQYEVDALQTNQWGLSGVWNVGPEFSTGSAGASIRFRFHARDLNLVLGNGGAGPLRFRISLDGAPLGSSHGGDAGADGRGVVDEDRMYQLVRQHGPIVDRTFEIIFEDAGVAAYVFTFG